MKQLLLIFVLAFSVCSHAQKLIILHTNDHHGQFMPDPNGDFGLAQQATLVKEVRKEAAKNGSHVLVLSGGDINTGAPESNMFRALPDIEAMNEIGYDAMVLGNHEFDISLTDLRLQEQQAKFPFLAANIKTEDGGKAFKDYVVKKVGNKTVAIVGLTTLETPDMSPAKNRPGLKWENPLVAQKKLIKDLRKKYDMVIGLSHMGYYPNEAPGGKYPGDEALMKALKLDFIFGAHTHVALEDAVKIGDGYIVQAGSEGKFVGKVEIDLSGKKPVLLSSELKPVKGYKPDLKVQKNNKKYLDKAAPVLSRKVGSTSDIFIGGREATKFADSPMGNLVASAINKSGKADIAFVHARGVRSGLPKGDITLRNLLSVSPFNNTVTTAELTGSEIWKTIEILNENYITKAGEGTNFSEGLEIEIIDKKVNKITLHGKEIPNSPTGKYKIATGNFYSEMVPAFDYIKTHPTYENTGVFEVTALEEYFKTHPQIHPQSLLHNTLRSPTLCGQPLLDALRELTK